MPQSITEPYLENPFSFGERESRWTALVALLATLLVHIVVILLLPAEFMPVSQQGKDEAQAEVYEISLVEPEEALFVEASPEAPENEPDRTEQYSYRSQQAADESPLEDLLNQPNVDGETDSQKILQGSLEQVPPTPPGVYAPTAKPGEGEGTDGGKLGAPAEVAMPLPPQPRPAPDFIKQKPVDAEGPGSHLEMTGDAQEISEVLDPNAPIEVYQPQQVPEQAQQPGDGSGGAVEAQPVPRARPRLAPELISGPLMKSQGSASRRGTLAIDATFSEFGEYEQQFYAAIQTGWYQEIEFFQPIDTSSYVKISFTLHSDGTVTDLVTIQTTSSELATFLCETAISKRSPFRPWTKEMVRVFGQKRTLYLSFHYL